VNGVPAPASLNVRGGEEQLVRVVSELSDSAKLLQLRDADGRPVPIRIVDLDGVPVGTEGARPLGQFVSSDHLMLSPGARVSILVTAAHGQTLTLSSAHFCEGSFGVFQMPHDLLRISGTADPGGEPTPSGMSVPVTLAETPAAKLIAYARAHPSRIRQRAITFTQYLFPRHGKIPVHSSYFITDTTDKHFHEHPYYPAYRMSDSVPAYADIVVKAGAIEEWYLFNTTMESHTFHIHQMTFVAPNGPAGVPAVVDSTFVPVGTLLPNPRDPSYPLVKPSVTKVLLDFRHVPRGTFVYHCHMLFHEDHGMMGIIRVE
jgi:FtsP/CotA-like multicopper oxidase with cupredoxin domain